jgi:hypothetical protein
VPINRLDELKYSPENQAISGQHNSLLSPKGAGAKCSFLADFGDCRLITAEFCFGLKAVIVGSPGISSAIK